MLGNSGFSGFPGFLKPKYPEKPEIPNSIFKEYTHWFSGKKDFAKGFLRTFYPTLRFVRRKSVENSNKIVSCLLSMFAYIFSLKWILRIWGI